MRFLSLRRCCDILKSSRQCPEWRIGNGGAISHPDPPATGLIYQIDGKPLGKACHGSFVDIIFT